MPKKNDSCDKRFTVLFIVDVEISKLSKFFTSDSLGCLDNIVDTLKGHKLQESAGSSFKEIFENHLEKEVDFIRFTTDQSDEHRYDSLTGFIISIGISPLIYCLNDFINGEKQDHYCGDYYKSLFYQLLSDRFIVKTLIISTTIQTAMNSGGNLVNAMIFSKIANDAFGSGFKFDINAISMISLQEYSVQLLKYLAISSTPILMNSFLYNILGPQISVMKESLVYMSPALAQLTYSVIQKTVDYSYQAIEHVFSSLEPNNSSEFNANEFF